MVLRGGEVERSERQEQCTRLDLSATSPESDNVEPRCQRTSVADRLSLCLETGVRVLTLCVRRLRPTRDVAIFAPRGVAVDGRRVTGARFDVSPFPQGRGCVLAVRLRGDGQGFRAHPRFVRRREGEERGTTRCERHAEISFAAMSV